MGESKQIEIMDCTLRDGEQTNGVSFLPHEKLMIARALLSDVKVDRIEIASARVSEGEKNAVRMISRYAELNGMLNKVEVLGFVDGNKSVDWIHDCGCRVINLLAKGSLKHCTLQLKKTAEEHLPRKAVLTEEANQTERVERGLHYGNAENNPRHVNGQYEDYQQCDFQSANQILLLLSHGHLPPHRPP